MRSRPVLQGRILLATEGAVQILESQNGQFIDGPLPLEVTDEFSEREISSNVGDATLVVFRPPTV